MWSGRCFTGGQLRVPLRQLQHPASPCRPACFLLSPHVGQFNTGRRIFPSYLFLPCIHEMLFAGGSLVKNLPASVGDVGVIPGSGRPPEEGNGNPLQCSCWGNPTDRGGWWATVHGVAELNMTEKIPPHARMPTRIHARMYTHIYTCTHTHARIHEMTLYS